MRRAVRRAARRRTATTCSSPPSSGFKLDLVIEAMPDIAFVYNEVYD